MRAAKHPATRSEQGYRLVVDQGLSVAEAARVVGISRGAVGLVYKRNGNFGHTPAGRLKLSALGKVQGKKSGALIRARSQENRPALLVAALNVLTANQNGASYSELAKIHNTTRSAIAGKISRARRWLKDEQNHA